MRIYGALFFVIAACLVSVAENKEQRARELIDKSVALLLNRTDNVPYHETVSFTVTSQAHPDIKGTFKRDFFDARHYRDELKTDSIDDIVIANGDKSWRNHPKGSVAGPATKIFSYIPPLLLDDPAWTVERVFQQRQHKDVQCIEFKNIAVTRCYDPKGFLEREEGLVYRAVYPRWSQLNGKYVPSHFEVKLKSEELITADVMFVSGDDIKSKDFLPSDASGLVEGPALCLSAKPPMVISSPDPEFQSGGGQGLVGLHAWIDTNGNTYDIEVVNRLSPRNDRAAIEAVRRWKFKPATCEGQPIPHQINIDINFRQ